MPDGVVNVGLVIVVVIGELVSADDPSAELVLEIAGVLKVIGVLGGLKVLVVGVVDVSDGDVVGLDRVDVKPIDGVTVEGELDVRDELPKAPLVDPKELVEPIEPAENADGVDEDENVLVDSELDVGELTLVVLGVRSELPDDPLLRLVPNVVLGVGIQGPCSEV